MISQQTTMDTRVKEEKKEVAQELHDGVLGECLVSYELRWLKWISGWAVSQRSGYLSS
jgi:signal transduction histidine kinase